tara:strand:- start:713 stop:1468 length:756 start_codon:yes stop_codon:yes gene_type:complete
MSNKATTCPKCKKSFSSKGYLKRHLNRTKPCDEPCICSKCGASFESPGLLNKHLRRKTPCVKVEEEIKESDTTCEYCDKTFSSISNLNKHTRNVCKKKKTQNTLEKEVSELKTLLKAYMEAQQKGVTINNTVNNVQNIQNNLYVNVQICSFGDEDLSIIDTNNMIKLLEGQIKDFMPKMIEHVHANPKHPEYHNVFYDPKRQKAIVFTPTAPGGKEKWHAREMREVSRAITDKLKKHMHPLNGPYYNDLSR